jgi:hypothetical protein
MCEPGKSCDEYDSNDVDISRAIVKATIAACRELGGTDVHMLTALVAMLHKHAEAFGRPFWRMMLDLTIAGYMTTATVKIKQFREEIAAKRAEAAAA